MGAVGAMARLMAGTVWLSPLSLQEVWACSSKPIAAAVAEEGRRRFQVLSRAEHICTLLLTLHLP